ncbi:MAG: hypothetical protein HOE11_04635 [Candidatus Diapherotrites archaeon]|jgi:hypothetical protein|nr:hypothetical protein [Candidatus Diapherotrites archaeon]
MGKGFLKLFSSKKSDDTSKPVSQVEFLRDFLSKHNYVFSNDFQKNLEILKRKHLVDSFVVTNFDGSIVAASEDTSQSEAIMGTAMLSYIKSELSDSEAVLIKREEGWFMLFALDKKVFIVRAGSELASIELKSLALELSILLEENKEALKKERKIIG